MEDHELKAILDEMNNLLHNMNVRIKSTKRELEVISKMAKINDETVVNVIDLIDQIVAPRSSHDLAQGLNTSFNELRGPAND